MDLSSLFLAERCIEVSSYFVERSRRLRTLSKSLSIEAYIFEIRNDAHYFTFSLKLHQEVSLVWLKVGENKVATIADRWNAEFIQLINKFFLSDEENFLFFDSLRAHLFSFIVEVKTFVLRNLIFARIEDVHKIVVHDSKVVVKRRQYQSIGVSLADIINQKGFYWSLCKGVSIIHFANNCAVVL